MPNKKALTYFTIVSGIKNQNKFELNNTSLGRIYAFSQTHLLSMAQEL